MKRAAVATMLLLALTGFAQAAQKGLRGTRACVVEVLYSEELPIGPLFHHTIKAVLLVTAPHTPPFERTVYEVIPWQMPPPRRGQRVRVRCDPAALVGIGRE